MCAFLLLGAALSNYNTWWNSLADTEYGHLLAILGFACMCLALFGFIAYSLAPRLMYRWSTLVAVVAASAFIVWILGSHSRTLRAAEHLEEVRQEEQRMKREALELEQFPRDFTTLENPESHPP
ncbi:hypothetical protein [Deinococcus hohokamensis]|uniref:Uncharacterized protein n=1 Tax=Deinococcus hohokamensis TaxID=309883 RepID=A0ABV9I5T3_9DEIO